jgi:hypothetical protein
MRQSHLHTVLAPMYEIAMKYLSKLSSVFTSSMQPASQPATLLCTASLGSLGSLGSPALPPGVRPIRAGVWCQPSLAAIINSYHRIKKPLIDSYQHHLSSTNHMCQADRFPLHISCSINHSRHTHWLSVRYVSTCPCGYNPSPLR